MSFRQPVFEKIDARLRELAGRSPGAGGWREAIARLPREAGDEQRLAVYQAVRNDGCLPDEAGFYLIALTVDEITSRSSDPRLGKIERRLERLERKYGLRPDDLWAEGEVPEDYEAASKRHHEIYDEIFRETLLAHGEREIAELFASDPPAYEAKFEAGRLYFMGTAFSTPGELEDWLDELMAAISRSISVETPIGPLACRYLADADAIEVLAYATPVEIVGGADDGDIVDPDFDLDLLRFRELFSSVSDFGFGALGLHDGGGPHIWIEGVFRGQLVYLLVLSHAPEDEEPGMKLDMIRKRRR